MIGYLIVLCFAFVAMLKIGHWPYYAHPDPKELGMPIWLAVSSYGFIASALGAFLIPSILALVHLLSRDKDAPKTKGAVILALVIYIIGVGLWVIDFSMGNFSNWVLD